jgi:hypothetical protein
MGTHAHFSALRFLHVKHKLEQLLLRKFVTCSRGWPFSRQIYLTQFIFHSTFPIVGNPQLITLRLLSAHHPWISLSSRTPRAVIINIRENRRDNQGWTIQRHWQHQVHKTQEEDKTEHKHTKQKTKKVEQHTTKNGCNPMMALSFNSGRTMDITSGAVTTFSFGLSGSSPDLSGIRAAQSLVFCLMFWGPMFVFFLLI